MRRAKDSQISNVHKSNMQGHNKCMLVCIWKTQRDCMTKKVPSSPTVSVEEMILAWAINAKENWDVVVTDIPGAFLHEDMEGTVHLLLKGIIAVKLDPRLYRKDVWHNQRWKSMLNGQLKKALYCTLRVKHDGLVLYTHPILSRIINARLDSIGQSVLNNHFATPSM